MRKIVTLSSNPLPSRERKIKAVNGD